MAGLLTHFHLKTIYLVDALLYVLLALALLPGTAAEVASARAVAPASDGGA